MSYAQVAVNVPTAIPRTFTYSVPPGIGVCIGSAVWVPFGPRTLQGVVFNIEDHSLLDEVKELTHTIGQKPLLTPHQVDLARWIAHYYASSYFEAATLMLPPGFERKTITYVQCTPDITRMSLDTLSAQQHEVLNLLLEEGGRVDIQELKKRIPQRQLKPTIDHLAQLGMVSKTVELDRARVTVKMGTLIQLAVDALHAQNEIAALEKKGAFKQAELLSMLVTQTGPMFEADIRKRVKYSPATLLSLKKKGLVLVEQTRIQRDPLANRDFPQATPPELTQSQEACWGQIRMSLQHSSDTGNSAVFLLHGVTGSGKTEIYLRALEETISLGKRGIVLVPEIALTPQTIARFAARFPQRVAVLHSKLSHGEHFDEWQRILDGEFDVVIGSRSALFAPQPDVGLIVIDEEHEWTYKQHDRPPLYHTRDVAIKLAQLTGAVVILGSATPEIESYHRTQTKQYNLIELPERVGKTHRGSFPSLASVDVIDMRQELKRGNRSIFSSRLARELDRALGAKEQVILFLNRRGTASFVQCRDCGHTIRCRRCEITLTYHATENRLICHQCNYRIPPPKSCPECESQRIKFLGIGTQKVEEETANAFPHARIIRWDRDVTRGKNTHEAILRKFQDHEADILIGTQMVAKGLDIPMVTLVGVINADVGLYLPDFRAGERTFQLLSQVAGRAGRGVRKGRVVIQTYTPEHYAITAAAAHDFPAFYRQEIEFRRQYGNPPFSRLVSLIYTHTNDQRCQEEAQRMIRLLKEERDAQGVPDTSLIGPTPTYTQRLRGKYRWQIVIRSPEPMTILSHITFPHGWIIDVDPVGLA